MTEHSLLYLSRRDVEQLALPMQEIISALEEMFLAKARNETEMPPKPGIHTLPDSFIHAMPASIPALGAAGLKWVSGYPKNPSRGLPYISGLLILNDPQTGIPLAVMDCTWITAMRTGAATAVAAKKLARTDSQSVGIIACGVQGRSNLEALACCFDVRLVKAYDLRPEVAESFAKQMSHLLDLQVEVVSSAEDAVRGCDIVVTSGPILKNPTPTIAADWMAPGAFASPVDFDSYWKGPALAQADLVITDDCEQFHYYQQQGYFRQTPQPHAELADVVAQAHPGRTSDEQRIFAINLGIGLEDMATAIRLYERARSSNVGTELPL